MAAQMPLDQVFIVSIWLEVRLLSSGSVCLFSWNILQAVLYGFLLALFLASLYVNVTLRKHQDVHSKVCMPVPFLYFQF